MKITVYTIKNCPFCKAEKEYLAAKGVWFDEKNVEENREYLSEMLDVSDKFAGVPFTHIVKDDGSEVKLKGFTREEFEEVFVEGLPTQPPASTVAADQPGHVTPPAVQSAPTDQKPPYVPPVVPPIGQNQMPPLIDQSTPPAPSPTPSPTPVVPPPSPTPVVPPQDQVPYVPPVNIGDGPETS